MVTMFFASTLRAAASIFICDCGARALQSWKALAPALLLLAACAPLGVASAKARASASTVRVGIETFLADVPRALRGKRVGLITKQSGIDRSRTSDIDLIAKHKHLKLVGLLG